MISAAATCRFTLRSDYVVTVVHCTFLLWCAWQVHLEGVIAKAERNGTMNRLNAIKLCDDALGRALTKENILRSWRLVSVNDISSAEQSMRPALPVACTLTLLQLSSILLRVCSFFVCSRVGCSRSIAL